MKKLCLFAIGLIISIAVHSQNYIPILIDSLFTWSWGVDHGDTIISESWEGLSYNSSDSLIQRRSPDSRVNYFYSIDTILLLAETLDTSDNWYFSSRTTNAFNNGKIISRLTERYKNNAWNNSALHSYFYESMQLDTLYLLQHWKNGMWVNFYKKEKIYGAKGNNIEEAEYYVGTNGDFEYNRGKLFEYDSANHQIQQIDINTSSNGEYYTRRMVWAYGGDDLLDTFSICDYSYPNDGTCTNVFMSTFDYLGQDTTVESRFRWDDNQWKYYGKELTFKGQEIYSNKPDSVIFYTYWAESQAHTPTMRRYLQYEELSDDSIYFKEQKYHYYEAANKWMLTRFIEEWYHIQKPLNVDDIAKYQEQLSIFPNPGHSGQKLKLKNNLAASGTIEVLIFDMNGRLVFSDILNSQSSFQAPEHEGIYTILIREKGQLIGYSKQLIIE